MNWNWRNRMLKSKHGKSEGHGGDRLLRRLIPVLSFAALLVTLPCYASDDIEARVKAAFIYNYARFIEWPQSDSQSPFTIAVVGQNDLRSVLEETVRGKTANGRRVQVKQLANLQDSDAFQILLIERSENKKMKDITKAIAGKTVLTVCDFDNCIRDGGIIAFRFVEDTVRFEVNLEAAERAGLRVSSQLLKVALPSTGKRK